MMDFVGGDRRPWSEKFDHLAAVTNIIIVPLTPGGTFYLIERLPSPSARSALQSVLLSDRRLPLRLHRPRRRVDRRGRGALRARWRWRMGAVCWLLFRSGWRLKS
jgi:ABC-2 type transport system permease protein